MSYYSSKNLGANTPPSRAAQEQYKKTGSTGVTFNKKTSTYTPSPHQSNSAKISQAEKVTLTPAQQAQALRDKFMGLNEQYNAAASNAKAIIKHVGKFASPEFKQVANEFRRFNQTGSRYWGNAIRGINTGMVNNVGVIKGIFTESQRRVDFVVNRANELNKLSKNIHTSPTVDPKNPQSNFIDPRKLKQNLNPTGGAGVKIETPIEVMAGAKPKTALPVILGVAAILFYLTTRKKGF